MSVCVVTGSCGLVGSEAVRFFSKHFDLVVGIDNDKRSDFFGPQASTNKTRLSLYRDVENYRHADIDITDHERVKEIFDRYDILIKLVVHAAAQPSHDWAAQDPMMDWSINATATLNLLQVTRRYCPRAVFIFCSTNKVYGDKPNEQPHYTYKDRFSGPSMISETLSIDQSTHSLFGVSKTAADLLCQEYGRYFGIKTGIFRCGCITGPNHAGAEQHGFLSYLVKCVVQEKPYTIYGYGGKQVRDNIHAYDLVNAFYHFYQNPRPGEVYNIGGGEHSNCSVLEAIGLAEKETGKKLNYTISDEVRKGDHRWYISDVSKFKSHYPDWDYKYSLQETIKQIYDSAK